MESIFEIFWLFCTRIWSIQDWTIQVVFDRRVQVKRKITAWQNAFLEQKTARKNAFYVFAKRGRFSGFSINEKWILSLKQFI